MVAARAMEDREHYRTALLDEQRHQLADPAVPDPAAYIAGVSR
jgi:hypothetical protein